MEEWVYDFLPHHLVDDQEIFSLSLLPKTVNVIQVNKLYSTLSTLGKPAWLT